MHIIYICDISSVGERNEGVIYVDYAELNEDMNQLISETPVFLVVDDSKLHVFVGGEINKVASKSLTDIAACIEENKGQELNNTDEVIMQFIVNCID